MHRRGGGGGGAASLHLYRAMHAAKPFGLTLLLNRGEVGGAVW